VNILRRLPLSRLLLLCGLVIAMGVSATALALALGSGPTPPPKPLAEDVHGALAAPAVDGVEASVKLTDHLLEGANLASEGGAAGQLASSPLLSGAEGRLWIAKDGRVRLELQAEKGDTQILYDGHTLSMYDASKNTLYRYTPPAKEGGSSAGADSTGAQADHHEVPTVAKIEEGLSHLGRHADVSEAMPTNVAGQPAYTVRISPNEPGSLIGGAELSWDAAHGMPLRVAIYSTTSPSPVIELAATGVHYGAIEDSVFNFTPPSSAKIDEVSTTGKGGAESSSPTAGEADRPHVTTHGHGITSIAVIETKPKEGESKSPLKLPEGLQQVKINAATATELPTALGTLLSFESSGVRYLLVGSVTPSTIEALARGL
jgi:outer membrane lipoprotein-sorting protein